MLSTEVTAARTIVVARVALGDGTGCVARRPDGLVFALATERWPGWTAALDAFVDAADTAAAVDALLVDVVDAGLVVDPFVVVHWSSPGRAVVFGDVELTSDLATLGRLSGVGSGGWVEHPLNVPVAGGVLHAGVAPQRPSRHEAGIAAAGGFRLDLQVRDAADFPEVVEPAPAPSPPARPATPAFDAEITLEAGEVLWAAPSGAPAAVGPPGVEAPALAASVLPGGDRLPLRGTIVIGRRPDAEAAKVDRGATLCPLDVGNDVSRTHLVVRAMGRTIEAVDCASSGQTVLLAAGSADPVMLEPWVPHEISVGDTLYLGGPTQLRVERVERVERIER